MDKHRRQALLIQKDNSDRFVCESARTIDVEVSFENYRKIIFLAEGIIKQAERAKAIHDLLALNGCDIKL